MGAQTTPIAQALATVFRNFLSSSSHLILNLEASRAEYSSIKASAEIFVLKYRSLLPLAVQLGSLLDNAHLSSSLGPAVLVVEVGLLLFSWFTLTV